MNHGLWFCLIFFSPWSHIFKCIYIFCKWKDKHLCWMVFALHSLSTKDFSLKGPVKCFHPEDQKTWRRNSGKWIFMYHMPFHMIIVYEHESFLLLWTPGIHCWKSLNKNQTPPNTKATLLFCRKKRLVTCSKKNDSDW